MPQKLNKAGKMQDYIPKGNGDASGEYGTSNGTNKNFTASDKKKSSANVITENTSLTPKKENGNKVIMSDRKDEETKANQKVVEANVIEMDNKIKVDEVKDKWVNPTIDYSTNKEINEVASMLNDKNTKVDFEILYKDKKGNDIKIDMKEQDADKFLASVGATVGTKATYLRNGERLSNTRIKVRNNGKEKEIVVNADTLKKLWDKTKNNGLLEKKQNGVYVIKANVIKNEDDD